MMKYHLSLDTKNNDVPSFYENQWKGNLYNANE